MYLVSSRTQYLLRHVAIQKFLQTGTSRPYAILLQPNSKVISCLL